MRRSCATLRCARNPAGMSRDDQEFWGHCKAEAFPQYVDAGDADDEDDDDGDDNDDGDDGDSDDDDDNDDDDDDNHDDDAADDDDIVLIILARAGSEDSDHPDGRAGLHPVASHSP